MGAGGVGDSSKNLRLGQSSGTYSEINEEDDSGSGAGSYDRLAMCFLCRKEILLSQFKKHTLECEQIRQSSSLGLDETYKDDFEEETQQFA